MQKHIFLTLGGVAAGMLALAWLEPQATGGAMLVVVLCMLLSNALGIVASGLMRLLGTSPPPPLTADPPSVAPQIAPPQPAASSVRSRRKRSARLGLFTLLVSLWPAALAAQPPPSAGPSVGPRMPPPLDSVYPRQRIERPSEAAINSTRTAFEALTSAKRALRLRDIDDARSMLTIALAHAREFPQHEQRDSLVAALTNGLEAVAKGEIETATRELNRAELIISMIAQIIVGGNVSTLGSGALVGIWPPTSAPNVFLSSDFRRLLPARVFMRANEIPPSGVGAYGVFALRARPTPASLGRLKMVCASYLASLPAQSTLPSSVPLQDQMLTVWPLESAGKPEANLDDCDHLLNNYDLHGGLSAIQDADRQGQNLTGRGPYLIGWSPSHSRHVRDAVVLVIDLSALESQQSFDEMFLIWQKRIVENPELWRSGFSVERLRLAIRDFVDRYGQSILDSVKLIRSGG